MRHTRRATLRAQLDEAVGHCEWPGCGTPTDRLELAHLHSVGMGGRGSADTIHNVILACYTHARYTDGERPGSPTDDRRDTAAAEWVASDSHYRAAHIDLFRAARYADPADAYERAAADARLAYARVQAFRTVIFRTRGWLAPHS